VVVVQALEVEPVEQALLQQMLLTVVQEHNLEEVGVEELLELQMLGALEEMGKLNSLGSLVWI
jgi:hypothetical protein